VGNDNLFQSKIFSNTISNLVGSRIEMVETTGAAGAAKASGVAIGIYNSIEEAVRRTKILQVYEPTDQNHNLVEAYQCWNQDLEKAMQ